MTRQALMLRNRKRKLWRKYVRTHDADCYRRFVRARNDLRRLTRRLRQEFERTLLGMLKDKVKPFWRYINSRLKTKPNIGDLQKSDGSLTLSDQEKADVLAKFFASVFTIEGCSRQGWPI